MAIVAQPDDRIEISHDVFRLWVVAPDGETQLIEVFTDDSVEAGEWEWPVASSDLLCPACRMEVAAAEAARKEVVPA